MTRLVANLALDKEIGNSLANMNELEGLIRLSSEDIDEELKLNVISCLANVSYYSVPGTRIFTCLYLAIPRKKKTLM
jgi:hypothetical protein